METKKEGPILEIVDLKKYYPGRSGLFSRQGAGVRAVDGVSFTLDKGETLGLVGESGCGKSTLGRQIVGLERPTEGSILYEGKELAAMSPRQLRPVRTQLQMVFQDSFSSLNPRKRVFDILSEPMLYHKLADKTTVQREVERLLDMVGLTKNALDRYPHEFSGGQRQRIGIARALSLKPRLLVCDEPVSALDVSIQAQILNLLQDLQKELGLTCIFIGHGLGAVSYVSSRIAVMYLGRIMEIGDKKELFSHPVHPYSRALFQAVPIPDPRARKRLGNELLLGEAASEAASSGECPFYPRCPYRKDVCREKTAELQPVEPGGSHLAACVRFGEIKKEGERQCQNI